MITEKQLNTLRENQERLMPNKVTVKRRLNLGEDEGRYETVLEDQKCRYTPGFGYWRLVADRFQGITPFTLGFPYETDVRAGDHIIDEYAHNYEVRDVRDPASYHTAVQVLADQVN